MASASGVTAGLISKTDYDTFNGKQDALGFTPENSANKNAANGYAGLTASTKLNLAQMQEVMAAGDLSDLSGLFGSSPGTKAVTTALASDPTTDNCVKWVAGGKLGDAGAACGTGGGGGITTLNSLTATTQYFGTPGTSGTAPNWSSVTDTHTLNIPLASASSVTAGLISKTDYDTFNGKENVLTFNSPLSRSVNTVSCPTCSVTGHTHAESDVINLVSDLAAKEATANKNAANGYAGLTASTRLNLAQMQEVMAAGDLSDLSGLFGSSPGTKAVTTALASDPTTDNCVKWIAGGKLGDAGAACGTGGGGGITTLNSLTATTQYFGTPGTSGTAPNWSSVTDTHTLNIPLASAASVTAGLISKTDYDTFNGKENVLTFNSPLSRSTNTVSCPTCATGSSLTSNRLPKVSTSPGLTDSLLSDNGTTLTYTGTAGISAATFSTTGSGPAILKGTEGACAGAESGKDVFCLGDATGHRAQVSNNGGAFSNVLLASDSVEYTANKNAANGYAGLTASTKLNLAQMQEVMAAGDLSDLSGLFGSSPGTKAVTTALASDPTTDNCVKWVAGGQLGDAGAACGTGGGGGITTLNSLTATTQYFATPGTSGTAPNWSSVTDTHTLNIPLASASSVTAGLISKTDYDTFNGKENVLTFSSPLSRSVNTVTCPTCSVTGHTHAESDVTNLVSDLAAKEATANKNAANGYAGLTASTKLTLAQMQEVMAAGDLSDLSGLFGSSPGTKAVTTALASDPTTDNCVKWIAGGKLGDAGAACGGGGAVTSVFGRTGDVVAQANDYRLDQIASPNAGVTFQPTTDGTFVFRQYNGTNAVDIFQVQTKTPTTVFSVSKEGYVNLASLQVSSGTLRMNALLTNIILQGGQDGTSTSTLGGFTLRGGNNTTTGTTGKGGPGVIAGGTTAGTADNSGPISIYPGGSTNASPGLPGLLDISNSYKVGGTVTATYVQCLTGSYSVADCGTSATNPVGVALTTTNPVRVQFAGITTVTYDGTYSPSYAWFACTSATVGGKVTPQAAACAAGREVGIVVSSGSSVTSGPVQLTLAAVGGGGGGGITSLNGLTATTQYFATPGTSGTAPNWSSVTDTHTLNIPMASSASVTAGLISKTDYDTFNGKPNLVTAGSAGIAAFNAGTNTTAARSDHTHRQFMSLSWFFPGAVVAGVQAARALVPEGVTNCILTNSRISVNTTSSSSSTYNIQRCTGGAGNCSSTANIYSSDVTLGASTESVAGGTPTTTTVTAGDAFRVNLVTVGSGLADVSVTLSYKCECTN
jgi:hypothetical protein